MGITLSRTSKLPQPPSGVGKPLTSWITALYASIADAQKKTFDSLHDRQHSIASTGDHTGTAAPGFVFVANANGLPVDSSITRVSTGTGLQFISVGTGSGVMAIGFDNSTGERGILQKMTNLSGTTSIKGTVVALGATSSTAGWVPQTIEYNAIGVVQEGGITHGGETWLWVNGSLAEVRMTNTAAATGAAEIVVCAASDGMADVVSLGGGLPGVDVHFKEIGHNVFSFTASTGALRLVHLHFN
jgi:hypothetical protein